MEQGGFRAYATLVSGEDADQPPREPEKGGLALGRYVCMHVYIHIQGGMKGRIG